MSKEPLFVAISNQKGGVGKSALTVVLASYFHFEKDLNVAIIDCDSPQHSLVRMRERDKKTVTGSTYYQQLLRQQWERVQKKAYPIVGSTAERQGRRRTRLPQAGTMTLYSWTCRERWSLRGVPHHRQYGLCLDSHHSRPHHHAEYARLFNHGA